MSHLQAQRLLSISASKYWSLIRGGQIEVRQIGKSSMPTLASIKKLAGVTAPT